MAIHLYVSAAVGLAGPVPARVRAAVRERVRALALVLVVGPLALVNVAVRVRHLPAAAPLALDERAHVDAVGRECLRRALQKRLPRPPTRRDPLYSTRLSAHGGRLRAARFAVGGGGDEPSKP